MDTAEAGTAAVVPTATTAVAVAVLTTAATTAGAAGVAITITSSIRKQKMSRSTYSSNRRKIGSSNLTEVTTVKTTEAATATFAIS